MLLRALGGIHIKFLCFSLLCFSSFMLISCASSNVTRTTSTNIDLGVQNAKNLFNGVYNGDIAEAYQNTNQTTKGAFLGGAAGGITGFFASGIGVLPGLATGAILGASYGAYIDSNTNFEDKLENRGATLVVLGDQVMVILPSARIFQAYTATIKPQAYSTLYMVARYINRYTKMLVKITVYTNDTGSASTDLALSNQQAYAISRFLQASGVEARVLYASGCGGTKLVDSTSATWDESDNYRIEITLEKLYV